LSALQQQEAHVRASELYASITQRIITDLENGVATWVQPWKNVRQNGKMPTNGATNRPYSGSNILILWHERLMCEYQTSRWMTYKQALALGGQVRKREKSTAVLFTQQLTVKDKESEEDKRVGMMKVFHVFNEDQIDGLPKRELDLLPPVNPIPAIEAFVRATGAYIHVGGNIAAYDRQRDEILMPYPAQFRSIEHYYSVVLHELVHYSGAERRLNRDLSGRFGSKAYAAEELVAELGSAFLCGHLNIQGELRHAEYIHKWKRLLQEDDRAIVTAASLASKAADFSRAFGERVVSLEAAE